MRTGVLCGWSNPSWQGIAARSYVGGARPIMKTLVLPVGHQLGPRGSRVCCYAVLHKKEGLVGLRA